MREKESGGSRVSQNNEKTIQGKGTNTRRGKEKKFFKLPGEKKGPETHDD